MSAEALALMMAYAERTGLVGDAPNKRALWADAFAVCNFVALDRVSLAGELVDTVHRTLGRHRDDDGRAGWLSGFSGVEAILHPTRAGLRSGMPRQERGPLDTLVEGDEWDRDGQYFHYLTKWMMALSRYSYVAMRPEALIWARELGAIAQLKFTAGPRMMWKMSIDLSRPQIPTMGQHDPIDGTITLLELDAITTRTRGPRTPPLDDATRVLYQMIGSCTLATTDPLGLGALLHDAYRASTVDAARELVPVLLGAATAGLDAYANSTALGEPPERRLAFRELFLAIGLSAIERLGHDLGRYLAVRDNIVAFWRYMPHREQRSWMDHRDINDVMLATALYPDGVL
ncbi:MAG TPA: hypothetical protein VGM90_01470 [Kofleriaceae bacterium]|jgi:hypothetical protein